MSKSSAELKETLKGLRTELVASMALFNRGTPEVDSYNQGLQKAVHFVDNYIKGTGLFQLVPDRKKDDKKDSK